MPPRLNSDQFQNKVIDFIGERLGIHAYASFEGCNQKTQLNSVLLEAASHFNFGSDRQMRRWWYYFQKYGYVPAEKNKYKRTSKRLGKQKQASQWTPAHLRILEEVIEDDPDLYLDEIQYVLWELGQGYWSASHLWEKLTIDLEFSLQVAADKSYSADLEERKQFIQALKDRLIDPCQLLFMDESQKDRNSSRRRRSWSKKGISPSRDAYFDGSHGKKYTFLAVSDIDGFIPDGCATIEQAHGAVDSNTTRGTVDQQRFELYIKEKVVPLIGRYKEGKPRSILVIDNAIIHQRIREIIEHPDVGGKVIFTAPYSPDLNPIEMMFNSYKSALKRHSSTNTPWDVAHAYGIKSVTPDIARSYFRHCGIPLCDHFVSIDEIERRKQYADLIEVIGLATAAKVSQVHRRRQQR